MKKYAFFALFISILFFSCKGDDTPTCTMCNSQFTPAFELCKESNGNASVNGQDTGISYGVYFDGLVNEGVQCN